MPLRLITGTANAGKTGVVYDRIRESLAEGRRPVLVVPSEPDAERARAELTREYPVGVRVETFERFIDRTWEELGDGREVVSTSQRSLLCASAARAEGRPAGVGLLAERCAILLAEQTGIGWRTSGTTGVPRAGAGLAAVIHAYAELLEGLQLIEPAEAAHLLAESGPAHTDAMVLHRFADFTASQEAYIRARSSRGEVWISLTWREGFAPTAASDSLVARLAPDEVRSIDETHTTEATLSELAEALFGKPAALVAGDAVRFSLAEGSEAEAVRIAEEIKTALLEETANSGAQIAVVFRNPELHYQPLRQAFAEAGIRADFDVRTSFRRVPFGSALSHVMAFALRAERADLLALLRSPFSGTDRERVRGLEREWRLRNLTDRDELMREVRVASPGLADVLDHWIAAAAAPLDVGSAETLAAAVRKLLVLGYGREGIQATTRQELDAWAHRTTIDMLSDVARLLPGKVGLAELDEALSAQAVGPKETERPGHVQVTSATRIRGRRFETVILGGLNAGEFPAAAPESVLPGSAAEAVMSAFGGCAERPGGLEYEQLLFYLVISRARKRVVLSAQTTDSDGDSRVVSPFFEVVCDNFRVPTEDDTWPPHSFRALSEAPQMDGHSSGRENARAAAYAGLLVSPRVAAAARRSFARPGRIEDEDLRSRLSAREVFSASELETYLDCPYKWFYSRAVRADELERRFGAAEQGELAHELLHRAYALLVEQGVRRVEADTIAAAEAALSTAHATISRERGPSANVEERMARMAAARWAARILGDDASLLPGFRPAYLEWSFGSDDPVSVGSFCLKGRVDRIDVDAKGRAVVTDYKRSAVFKAADIVAKGKVQLPLYMAAVERELGLTPVGGLYRALSKRNDRGIISSAIADGDFVSTDVKSPEEFAAITTQGLALAEEAVAGIRSARIGCEPRTSASCTHCKAALSCGGAS